jgi:HKD family nuclease
MSGNMDLTFITNQPNQKLSDRFNQLIKDARFFDCLVGYFYISGFNLIKDALRNAEKIRILVGLNISPEIKSALSRESIDEEELSEKQIKEKHSELIKLEFENSEENIEVEKGIKEFVNFIKSGKLEVKIYPEKRLHAKLYIITFKEGDRDIGRVITGSSNLTYSGLVDNLEFNVELKNRSDYEFAKSKFEELWKDVETIDVTEKVTDVITNHTWLKEDITPYH